jgi:type VI secretion system protein VasG
MAVNLKALIGKLNDSTRGALESAAGLCLSRTHYDIEIEHYLLKLLEAADTDFASILPEFGIDRTRLTAELSRSLDKLKTGNARTPAFSPSLVKMFSQAWTVGSMDYDAARVRSAFTILALASDEDLARIVGASSREFARIEAEALRKKLPALLSSAEAESAISDVQAAPVAGKTPHLDQYTVNLTENARNGKIDPVLGRDAEIRQIVDILCRRRQNNPILTGEAGVGKTAVVEGFALRVARGDVPPSLQNVTLRTLDLALLQAGAGIKGEFENRLKGLIQEVKASAAPIILFIDEAHTMIGAGGQAGQGDAANLLKPALARGELRTIAATTWSEYKKYFEKDPALARRFQVVKVEEPSETQCELMLRGVTETLERHHNVRILDEGLRAAVRLSHRYLPERQLPDKAVSVLDTACARLSLGQNSTPAAIEDTTQRMDDLSAQKRILECEVEMGADHADRLAELAAAYRQCEGELVALRSRWERESGLVSRIREVRTAIEQAREAKLEPAAMAGAEHAVALAPSPDPAALRSELASLNAELEAIQGEAPLVRVCVDAQVVGDVVSAWTGIPVGKMLKDEVSAVLSLEDHLTRRVVGQQHALAAISERIRASKARLEDPSKPIGVFLLVGPSGVGKTETALALSDLLYGGERNLITINMSEFQEPHTVSTLKGSPPGYVGYGEGGVLTEAVRRHPYSVVLLDEVEKAHPRVLELFFQVFDKGRMEDGEGREVDFRNTIIILTSNAATDTIMKLTADPETAPAPDALVQALKPELNRIFKPAFLGRTVIIPYYPVRDAILAKIVLLKLTRIERRIEETHRVALTHDDRLVDEIVRRCTEVESGARNVDNILTSSLLPGVSRRILESLATREPLQSIRVGLDDAGEFAYA